MKPLFTLVLSLLLTASVTFAQVKVTKTNVFYTKDQMLLANEINESGEPFAEALGYDLDLLDPMILNTPDSIAYTLGIENYEYSRYQLGTVISRSGIGLHMMWSPMIMQMAMMEDSTFDGKFTKGMKNGIKEDDVLMKNIMHFGMLANQMAPMNPWPQFAEFESGNPHLPQPVAAGFQSDFASLRWDRSKMSKVLNPAAMGQTLMKQYLWAQDMLGGFHDSLDNAITPTGSNSPDSAGSPHFDASNNIYYGGNSLDGFIGQVLTAESINKTLFLINKLAYDGNSLGMVDPATYDPSKGIKYFPHKISVTETMVDSMLPPKASGFTVTDAASDLFDQISFLWGTLNFKNMMDPNINDETHLAYHEVFDGDPFPAPMAQTGMPGPFDLMMGTSKVIFMNLLAMHFNSTEKTFVNTSGLSGGMPQPGNIISAVNAGYLLTVLAKTKEEFSGTPIETMALNALNDQANFVISKLLDAQGGFYNGYTTGQGADNSVKTAEAQAALANGLYTAYELTQNTAYLAAADLAYSYLKNNFWVAAEHAFKTELNKDVATYTPFNFAVITGGLRMAALVGNHSEAAVIYTRFFKKVANKMQLAEFEPTGESGSDSDGDGIPYLYGQPDNLAPVFAEEARLTFKTSAINYSFATQNDNILEVYPSPISGTAHIIITNNNTYLLRAEVVNYLGQTVQLLFDGTINEGKAFIEWDASKQTPGVYFIRISKNGINTNTTQVVVL